MANSQTPLDVNATADAIDANLKSAGDPIRGEHDLAYLKAPDGIISYGLGMPEMRRQMKAFLRDHRDLSADDLVALVENLWERPIHSTRTCAVELLKQRSSDLSPDHVNLIERMIRESFTWAYVDTLSGNIAASLVRRFPELLITLDRWSKDESFWVRRASMLSLPLPSSADDGEFGRFTRYADSMLEEKEFFIRKAIGWILREVSKKRPELVVGFLEPRIDRVAGLTLREGAKYLPDTDSERLITAYKNR